MSRLQAADAIAEVCDEERQVAEQPRRLGDWLTVKDLADWLRFPSARACRMWLRRHRIASVRRGRVILVSRRDVEIELRRVR